MKSTIEVINKDGQRLSSDVSAIKGNPLNPMSIEECMEKFRKCVDFGPKKIRQETISKILDLLGNLENVKDINELTELIH
jgi:2-methylcitrate dehydratase PrpD